MRRLVARALAVGAALCLAATGCTPQQPQPPLPPPVASSATPPEQREFTIATTEAPTTFDPAGASTQADGIIAYNAFQRLMTTAPGDPVSKPDAADCLFTSPVVYQCKIREGVVFGNGEPVTSNDVKFSILRAYRLGAKTTAVALASLDKIDTPSDRVVEFKLKWADNQFGYALASPNASIVSAKEYPADSLRPSNLAVVGSGPYAVSNVATNGVLFTAQRRYVGFSAPGMDRILVSYFKDSAAIEDAVAKGAVDMTWRGLTTAAVTRLQNLAKRNSTPGAPATFRAITLANAQLQELQWNPSSGARADANLRQVVATALQGDRTLDSLLPPGIDAHTAAYPLGGQASIPPLAGQRLRLTLSYVAAAPNQQELASSIRDRLETAGVSVQLLPDSADADLRLSESPAWVTAPVAYLQPYLAAPLPGSAQKLTELDQRYRGVTDRDQQLVALSEIQKQAAADLTVVPIRQDDAVLFLGPGVSIVEPRYGPGWQLALWSIRK